jgi:hypothetical protein
MTYTIQMLPEGQMSISGAVLDGVTQGDGSHMIGATVTLNSTAWLAVEIADDDADFGDNDTGQRLAQDIVIDGVSFPAGSVVEAEYSLTATDGTTTWTLVAFNVNNSSPAYATVEGLAFIGPSGTLPPAGTTLTVTGAQEGPVFSSSDYMTPLCFVAGTRIAVPGGEVPVETLRPGDMVLTCDHGPQPVLWMGQRTVRAEGRFAPVEFAPGAIGNRAPLRLSRQHRVRHSGWRAELLFGEASVLIPAVHLVDGDRVRVVEGGLVTYVHLMFDGHRIVWAEGAEAESFHATIGNLGRLSRAGREELLSLFPELAEGGAPVPLAHPVLRGREARALLAG